MRKLKRMQAARAAQQKAVEAEKAELAAELSEQRSR